MVEKIEIIIKRREEERRKRRGKGAPKDIGSRRRNVEPRPRRLRQSGLINFWDLGQRRNGETWEDLDYAFFTV